MKPIALFLIAGLAGFLTTRVVLNARTHNTSPPATVDSGVKPADESVRLMTRLKPWSDLRGNSTGEYVANLREISCPEEPVSDLVYRTLFQELDAKIPPALRMDIPTLHARERDIQTEMENAGLPYYYQKQNYFFPGEQLTLVYKSLRAYPLEAAEPDTNEFSRKAMLGRLTREQWIYFRSEFEYFGPTIVRTLAGFRPTREEFYGMVIAMEHNTSQELLERLPAVLSPARYQQFLENRTPVHIGVYELCEYNPTLKAKAPRMIELLNQRTNMAVAEFRKQAMDLVGPFGFTQFISIGSN